MNLVNRLDADDRYGTWIPLATRRPRDGTLALVYLPRATGIVAYRVAMRMGPNDWLSPSTFHDPNAVLHDADVSHWMPLPDRPEV